MSEQVCAAEREVAAEFFTDDHAGTVTVSPRTISFDISSEPQVRAWWRISDADFIFLAAHGLGDVLTRIQEARGPFGGCLGEPQNTPRGWLSIRQIA